MGRRGGMGKYRGWTRRGLGDINDLAALDPEPISSSILKIVGMISRLLGIGAGRMEADVIVPIQNEVVASVIGPASAYLTPGQTTPDTSQLTQQDLDVIQQALEKTERVWLDFLHNTSWKDGRAANQAETTLAPYFSGLLGRVRELRATAPTSIIQSITGGSNVEITGADIPGGPPPETFGGGSSSGPHVLTAGISTFMPLLLGLGVLFWFSKSRKKYM
jgi:hypothetical protein